MPTISLGAASLNLTPLDWENNSLAIQLAVEEAKNQHIRVLCLPELTVSGYGCQDMFFSPWVAEVALSNMLKLIPKSKGIYFTIGIPIFVEGKLYNGVAFIGDEQLHGIVLKQNLPDDGIYYEPRWFTPWPSGKVVRVNVNGEEIEVGDLMFEVDGVKIAFEICEDAWRQQRPAINHFKNKVQVILNPSASHFEFGKVMVREALMRNSSEKFNCTYVYANLLGNEAGRLLYEGDLIIANRGKIINRGKWLKPGRFQLIQSEVEVDQQPENYIETPLIEKNQQFYEAATLGLFDYLRKSKSACFIVSLSGGADSSTCALLVHLMIKRMTEELGEDSFLKMIGREELKELPASEWTSKILYCVYQATENSSETTFSAAKTLAEELGATFYHWSIESEWTSARKKVEQAIGRELTWTRDDVSLQNLQARMRSPFVWTLANIFNGLLLTTSNRSEGDVGYATMDGDTSGSLAPIAGVDKVFVRSWLVWAENYFNLKSLHLVNVQAPTAELRPADQHQTDEEDLMPYPILLAIERAFLINKLDVNQIKEKIKIEFELSEEIGAAYIHRFFSLWTRNQWKRERIAPSFHFDDFNIDPKTWMRFPILNGGLTQIK